MGGIAHLQSRCHAESRAIFRHGNGIKGIPLCSQPDRSTAPTRSLRTAGCNIFCIPLPDITSSVS